MLGSSISLVALLVLPLLVQDEGIEAASVRCTLTDQPGPQGEPGHWRVVTEVRGLDPSLGALELSSFGGTWPPERRFLELLECDPPLAAWGENEASLRLERPEGWDGSARVVHRVRLTRRGSQEHASFELVPSRGDGFAYGPSDSVLLQPRQAGVPLASDVEFQLIASDGANVLVSGWGGRSTGRQEVRPEDAWGSSPIVFGTPTAMRLASSEGVRVETFQFCGPDVSQHATELALRLVPAMQQATGWSARSPSRLFLSNALSAGMASSHGLHMNVPVQVGAPWRPGSEFDTTLAHELFHEWLGIRLHESHGSLVWFREGFTEYFAQWFVVAVGAGPPADFAATLEEYDRFARRNTALGRVSFADPGVDWRDGDGPHELMAYRGGPVLALALDVELRAAGHPGLLQLVRDLLAREEHVFPPEDLRAWFVENGLEQRWRTSIAGRDVPTAAESLRRAGFEPVQDPIEVAYLGLQAEEHKPVWHVQAVDPLGPAGRAGVLVGDVIEGFFPFTGAPVPLGELESPYTFGLDIVAPGIEGAFLDLVRDGETLRLSVEPELRPWGVRTRWRATPQVQSFFSFE